MVGEYRPIVWSVFFKSPYTWAHTVSYIVQKTFPRVQWEIICSKSVSTILLVHIKNQASARQITNTTFKLLLVKVFVQLRTNYEYIAAKVRFMAYGLYYN